MSEGDITRDTLDGLRVKNKFSQYQVSVRRRCSTSDCLEEDGPHCDLDEINLTEVCPLMPW